MTNDTVPLAETVSATLLFIVGCVGAYYSAAYAAVICFGMVGVIACVRSYTRWLEVQTTADYYND